MRSSGVGSVLVETLDEGVLVLTLNRPERRNAIDPELRDALAAALDRAGTAEAVHGDPVDVAHARVMKMLARAPLSFAAAKRLLQLAADADQRSAILAESLAQTTLLQSDDHREGLAAARERRDPVFRGA